MEYLNYSSARYFIALVTTAFVVLVPCIPHISEVSSNIDRRIHFQIILDSIQFTSYKDKSKLNVELMSNLKIEVLFAG